MIRKGWTLVAFITLIGLLLHSNALARNNNAEEMDKLKNLEQIWVWDGTGIHNVGNLHMHVCNWGCFGSYPTSRWPTAEYPSAQWPANSGVEYLWIAGLWVGAKKGGVPVVSTSAYDIEFRPDSHDENCKIYKAQEGMAGGARLPAPADDDKDGRVDEDWLNGEDDDGDGKYDEDFAAIGKQMFTCWFTDDQPSAAQAYPEHTPLHLLVRQESYQWEEEKFYNFVGVEYKIKNYGSDIIEDIYIGFFADGDAGPRTREQYWMDDCTALYTRPPVCAEKGERQVPINVSIAYFYDKDTDEGQTPGYFGILFLGHDTDPLGETAPKRVGITSYQNFSGDQSYENGGDPTNDFQRYELMSKKGFDRAAEVPRDYRMMMATGPFRELLPDSSMILQVAFVCGNQLEGMKKSAASAASAYQGNWFDLDGNSQTGINGRETPLYGPANGIDPDSCDADLELLSAVKGEIIWINLDCFEEIALYEDQNCPKGNATFHDFQTGVDGKEGRVNWLVGSAPPPPNMRLIPGDHKVTLLWDNFSEVTPDVSTLEDDFEGYRVWRADGWERPLGTSILTGPSRELWQLIEERDYINDVPPNIDFQRPFSEGGWGYEPLGNLPDKEKIIEMFEESVWYFPLDTVPCPPGLTDSECDTIEALARYNLGFEGGMRYYKFVDTDVHNGMHYFYSVTAYDHVLSHNVPVKVGKFGDPAANFQYIVPLSDAQECETYDETEVYVVPNPATVETMEPWSLEPNMDDPTGIKVEFRNLPKCFCTVRVYTVAGDLVEIMYHDGTTGHGTLMWDLVSRNGQDVTSGVYLFSVEPEDNCFQRTIGKFVVIR
jgi:hypothetical protein